MSDPCPACDSPTWVLAVTVSLLHVALLAGVYLSSGGPDSQVFVSTVLDEQIFFKVLLSMVVAFEALVCSVYVYFSAPPASHCALAWFTLFLLTALGGWACVAATRMGEEWHIKGTVIFLAGSAGYYVVLFSTAQSHKWVYVTLWVANLVCALSFLLFHFKQDYKSSAFVEWLTFMIQGTVLVIYFFENPLRGRRDSHAAVVIGQAGSGQAGSGQAGSGQAVGNAKARQAMGRGNAGKCRIVSDEAARPLLLLVNTSSQQQQAAGGRPASIHEEDDDGAW